MATLRLTKAFPQRHYSHAREKTLKDMEEGRETTHTNSSRRERERESVKVNMRRGSSDR